MARTRVRWARVGALGIAAALGIGSLAGRAGAGPVSRTYVVHRGDTVWAIARSIAGDGDPRPIVDRIIGENRLRDATVVPGERLEIPAG
jgi:nucleoid-associated protein YgaU